MIFKFHWQPWLLFIDQNNDNYQSLIILGPPVFDSQRIGKFIFTIMKNHKIGKYEISPKSHRIEILHSLTFLSNSYEIDMEAIFEKTPYMDS